MASVSKQKLGGSTDGKQIKVAATATPGTTIHTAPATGTWDEVWIWAVNSSSSDVKLTIEWGEATAPDGNIEITIPGESGYIPVIPGMILTNALVVKAFAGTTNVILLNGYANRITP